MLLCNLTLFRVNQVQHLRWQSEPLQARPTSFDRHLDSPACTTTKSPPVSTSTPSSHSLRLLLLHQLSSIQHHPTHSTATLSVSFSSPHDHLVSSVGLFVLNASLSIPHHRHQSQVHWLCSVIISWIAFQCSTIQSSCIQSISQCG